MDGSLTFLTEEHFIANIGEVVVRIFRLFATGGPFFTNISVVVVCVVSIAVDNPSFGNIVVVI